MERAREGSGFDAEAAFAGRVERARVDDPAVRRVDEGPRCVPHGGCVVDVAPVARAAEMGWALPNFGIQIARASRLTLLFESLLRSFALSPNTPPCSSTALPLYCADSPTRRSRRKAA